MAACTRTTRTTGGRPTPHMHGRGGGARRASAQAAHFQSGMGGTAQATLAHGEATHNTWPACDCSATDQRPTTAERLVKGQREDSPNGTKVAKQTEYGEREGRAEGPWLTAEMKSDLRSGSPTRGQHSPLTGRAKRPHAQRWTPFALSRAIHRRSPRLASREHQRRRV